MKEVLKQVAGIDVAQKELVVSLTRMNKDLSVEIYASKVFTNSEKGFVKLTQWAENLSIDTVPVRYVMEATGVYHEKFACYLAENGLEVSIILPNKISNYFRTMEIKTITDKSASEAISRFGVERILDCWERPRKIFKQLRQLTRERGQIIEERTMVKNQLHAERSEAYPNPRSLERITARIEFLNQQEKEVEAEIAQLIKEDKEVKSSIDNICTIPGVGVLTVATVLAETNGFELIRNRRQLTSYAGLDVREKLSGTSVKGKPRISKRGNKYLRKAMHLPALSAIKHDENFKATFANLVSKHGIKMKAAVAVQRKLLELIYTLYKTQQPYDKNFEQKRKSPITN